MTQVLVVATNQVVQVPSAGLGPQGPQGPTGDVSLTTLNARLAYAPDALLVGAQTRDANGALTSAAATWPGGATGTFTGTASATFPGLVDAYSITHVLGGVTTTYTQPTVTRNAAGAVTNRPAITVT